MGFKAVSLSYSLPALVLAPMAISYYVFVPKLYADLGTVSVQALGLAILLTRIWDAVTDPLIGFLSDRTNSRIGRRKPWLLLSVLPLGICFTLIFAVKEVSSDFHLLWFVALSALFFIFWTMYSIPYEALGQELVTDYDQRTALFAVRDGAIIAGTLLAALIPMLADWLLRDWAIWTRWAAVALVYSALLVAFTAHLQRSVPHGSRPRETAGRYSAIRSFRSSFSNEHFRRLLIAYSIASFGAALPATLFLFYVDAVLQSSLGPAFLALYFLIGILTLPLWTKISFRWGKKAAWLGALALNTTGFVGVYFLSAGQELAYGLLISISATGYGASLALPSSMQADVIDSEELTSGVRKEGEFLGVWSLAKKTAAAIGAGAALWVLGETGFDSQRAMQEPQAILALRLLYCVVPCICSFAAMFAIRNYSLSRDAHLQILSSIANLQRAKGL